VVVLYAHSPFTRVLVSQNLSMHNVDLLVVSAKSLHCALLD